MNRYCLMCSTLGLAGMVSVPAAHAGTVIGSSTYEGQTTVVTRNDDGTRTVTVTDRSGRTTVLGSPPPGPGISVDDGNGGFKRYIPPAPSPIIGSSTVEGRTTVVTRNPDGSHTVTVTDRDGRTTDATPARPPPGPGISVDDGRGGYQRYVPPAASPVIGSSTFEGRTTVVTRRPDGSHQVTVTELSPRAR